MKERILTIEGRQVTLFGDLSAKDIILHPVGAHNLERQAKDAERIRKAAGRKILLADFLTDWDRDLTPWPFPPEYEGKGEETLAFLTDRLLPEILSLRETEEAPRLFLAGYSLGGLFAVWAATRTDLFTGAAGASLSVWYPGLTEYLKEDPPKTDILYLSMGVKEGPMRFGGGERTIRTLAETISADLQERERPVTLLEWNPGSHATEPDLRMGRAVSWLLKAAEDPEAARPRLYEIATDRLILRPFKKWDAKEALKNFGSDEKCLAYIDYHPWTTREEMDAFLAMHEEGYEKDPDFYGWAITLDGKVIGSITLFEVDRKEQSCEMGYILGSPWWGQGLASEAAKAVADYALSHGFTRVTASRHPENEASGRVLEKAGLTRTRETEELIYYERG